MAEPRKSSAARAAVTVLALAATAGGWVGMVLGERSSTPELDVPSLAAIPTLAPAVEAPRARAARPVPLTTTRSSR